MNSTTIFLKRLMACIYELLILAAMAMLVTFVFISIFGSAETGVKRLFLQLLLICSFGFYFVYSWLKSGQTLAMRAWRLKLVNESGEPFQLPQLIKRFIISVLLMPTGVSLVWALVDKQHLFLHDKLAKTKVIYIPK
jgi:uncharacterized RDD family membrane protein YckC